MATWLFAALARITSAPHNIQRFTRQLEVNQAKVGELMANDSGDFISGGLQLETAASRKGTFGRTDGLRAGLPTPAVKQEGAAPAVGTSRPGLVTTVGIYEFCRAAIVGIVFAIFLANPDAHLASHSFWLVFFIVSNGTLGVSWFTLITFCYGVAIGLALFFRVDWGRRILIGTSALFGVSPGALPGCPLQSASG